MLQLKSDQTKGSEPFERCLSGAPLEDFWVLCCRWPGGGTGADGAAIYSATGQPRSSYHQSDHVQIRILLNAMVRQASVPKLQLCLLPDIDTSE